MAKYIHRYHTIQEFEDQYYGSGYTEPWLSYVDEADSISFNRIVRYYVDLGLQSGVLWAASDIGAGNIGVIGDQYYWAATEPDVEKYPQQNNGWPKYYYDNKNTLDEEDDAAVQQWGDGWRMPSPAEGRELLNLGDGDNGLRYISFDGHSQAGIPSYISGTTIIRGTNGDLLFLTSRYGDYNAEYGPWTNYVDSHDWDMPHAILSWGVATQERWETGPIRPVCTSPVRKARFSIKISDLLKSFVPYPDAIDGARVLAFNENDEPSLQTLDQFFDGSMYGYDILYPNSSIPSGSSERRNFARKMPAFLTNPQNPYGKVFRFTYGAELYTSQIYPDYTGIQEVDM